MGTGKSKKSKPRHTRNTGQTQEKEPEKQSSDSKNGKSPSTELRWIHSNDLRLVPSTLIEKSPREHLDSEAYYAAANMLLGNPLVFCLYGLNGDGTIQQAVFGHVDPMDRSLYLENLFNADLDDPGLKERVSALHKIYGSRAVYINRPEPFNLEA